MDKTFTDLSEELQKKLLEQGRRDLKSRAGKEKLTQNCIAFIPADRMMLCRIMTNQYGTLIYARRKERRMLRSLLETMQFPDALLDEDLCDKVLDALQIDKDDYPFRNGEVSEGRHGCRFSTEWICTADTFQPYDNNDIEVEVYQRQDVSFRNGEDFSDKLFRVMNGTQVAGYASCKQSHKGARVVHNAFSLQVGTHESFRNQGIAKATATANLRAILSRDGVAWSELKPENKGAIALARSLGFVYLGGVLTIR